MSRRYEHASTVLSSNKGFDEWGRVLGDDVMATALIDRVLHQCHIQSIFTVLSVVRIENVRNWELRPKPAGRYDLNLPPIPG